jgi:glycosyltransferase involved in cell wall biosynthesis
MSLDPLEIPFNNRFDGSLCFLIPILGVALHFTAIRIPLFIPALTGITIRCVLLTVLMPNYNKGPYIRRAVQSVLSQTFSNFELIVSDDESDDIPWTSLMLLFNSDIRIRFWVNQKTLGTNQNRAKCVCAAHGSCLLSLDSDDELRNRTAEVVVQTHQQTGADMIEFKSFGIDRHGRLRVFEWLPIPFASADNNTLVIAFGKGMINWTLWRKMIVRSIYEQALLMMGPEVCSAIINCGQDKLHLAIMYRFVHKFVRIDFFGYLYYQNIYNNSVRRNPNRRPILKLIDRLINRMLIRRLPDSFDHLALQILCSVITQSPNR